MFLSCRQPPDHLSTSISHSLLGFNVLAKPEDRLSEDEISFFVEKARVPDHLLVTLSDPTYGKKQPLFRRESGKARVTIFDGGHEIIYAAALSWLSHQRKE